MAEIMGTTRTAVLYTGVECRGFRKALEPRDIIPMVETQVAKETQMAKKTGPETEARFI